MLTKLLGTQKGRLQGTDLFFISENYFVKLLKLKSGFYKKAIKAIIALHPRKKITNLDEEKVFYNPIFTAAKEGVLRINKTCETLQIYTYGQIKREYDKKQKKEPHHTNIASIYGSNTWTPTIDRKTLYNSLRH